LCLHWLVSSFDVRSPFACFVFRFLCSICVIPHFDSSPIHLPPPLTTLTTNFSSTSRKFISPHSDLLLRDMRPHRDLLFTLRRFHSSFCDRPSPLASVSGDLRTRFAPFQFFACLSPISRHVNFSHSGLPQPATSIPRIPIFRSPSIHRLAFFRFLSRQGDMLADHVDLNRSSRPVPFNPRLSYLALAYVQLTAFVSSLSFRRRPPLPSLRICLPSLSCELTAFVFSSL
jgi:hypothetical protein